MVDQSALQLDVTQCPSWAGVLGYGGVAAAVCLSNWGSAVRPLVIECCSMVAPFRVVSVRLLGQPLR